MTTGGATRSTPRIGAGRVNRPCSLLLAIPNHKEDKMSNEICWLVTVLYGDTLILCALKAKREERGHVHVRF